MCCRFTLLACKIVSSYRKPWSATYIWFSAVGSGISSHKTHFNVRQTANKRDYEINFNPHSENHSSNPCQGLASAISSHVTMDSLHTNKSEICNQLSWHDEQGNKQEVLSMFSWMIDETGLDIHVFDLYKLVWGHINTLIWEPTVCQNIHQNVIYGILGDTMTNLMFFSDFWHPKSWSVSAKLQCTPGSSMNVDITGLTAYNRKLKGLLYCNMWCPERNQAWWSLYVFNWKLLRWDKVA